MKLTISWRCNITVFNNNFYYCLFFTRATSRWIIKRVTRFFFNNKNCTKKLSPTKFEYTKFFSRPKLCKSKILNTVVNSKIITVLTSVVKKNHNRCVACYIETIQYKKNNASCYTKQFEDLYFFHIEFVFFYGKWYYGQLRS